MATGSGARQTAPAFQDNFSFRGAPVSGGALEAVWQIGNSEKSIAGGAARNGKACAPNTPIGAANAAAAPLLSKVRRSSSDPLLCISRHSLLLFDRHSAAVGATFGIAAPDRFILAFSEIRFIPADFESAS